MRKYVLAVFVIVVLILSARAGKNIVPRRLELYPSPTVLPTQTERVIFLTTTPIYTYTPIVKEVTSTPNPVYLCVTADEAVHLRPSPSTENYPITPLPNGSKLIDMGGRDGNWAFVMFEDKQGWVNLNFAKLCE